MEFALVFGLGCILIAALIYFSVTEDNNSL